MVALHDDAAAAAKHTHRAASSDARVATSNLPQPLAIFLQVAARLAYSNSLFVFDWQDPALRLHTLLAGHTGNVTAAAACPALPPMLASGACEVLGQWWQLQLLCCPAFIT